ncbi:MULTISPECIES: Csu type fimbrial protein [unclassified Luteimonas]
MRAHRLLAIPLAALMFHASAQTTEAPTQAFNVTIDVTRVCLLDAASDISFGTVSPMAGSPATTGSIQVRCSTGTDYAVGLDQGRNWTDVRNMASDPDLIPYTLSSDAGHASAWGNEEGSWVTGVGQGLAAGQATQHQVHARATLTGNEPPGTYSDTVTATLIF